MTRQPVSQLVCWAVAFGMAAVLPAYRAGAEELPIRKAGLWEMKMATVGSPVPGMTIQQCTDETIDKQMSTMFAAVKQVCSKRDIQKTATGYVADSECTAGGATRTSHSEITGDFNSAYTVKFAAHSEHGPTGQPHDFTTTIEAKWLGACKADQKPGDFIMPGGLKMNINDMDKLKNDVDKLKALLPKQTPK
jgi:hypothetical protein